MTCTVVRNLYMKPRKSFIAIQQNLYESHLSRVWLASFFSDFMIHAFANHGLNDSQPEVVKCQPCERSRWESVKIDLFHGHYRYNVNYNVNLSYLSCYSTSERLNGSKYCSNLRLRTNTLRVNTFVSKLEKWNNILQ